MRRFWFQFSLWTAVLASVAALALTLPNFRAFAQTVPTDTPAPGSAPIVTAQEEGANVRSGPSSIDYPVIGRMQPGDTATAIGVSPHHEWIQIDYQGVKGWVYTAFVTLTPGFLPEVEPPPTPMPPSTATIDPTLAAAFNVLPTETRLPTFTPPPPLVVPTFPSSSGSGPGGLPMGIMIGVIAVIGAVVMGASFFGRR